HPLQLGLFDLDNRQTVPAENLDLLRRRLRELGGLLHSGLVRLWVDLQRERVGDVDSNVFEGARKRDDVSEALRQSLEVLGEIVVHPLMEALHEVPDRDVSSAAERLLPSKPSRFLRRLELPARGGESPRTWLERRLEALGFAGGGGEAADPAAEDASAAAAASQLLFVDVCLPAEAAGAEELAQERLAPLREALNRQVRDLYDFRFLADYRQRPTRQPPRLTVYVVGDMSEAFSREVMRHVLRELHAELLRAFTPIFESYRVGFDHCLCVTPILWMPHPADPFEGTKTVVSRCEEAAIIDAIHGIRRWVECVLPAGRRSISQIFVNSRVTDTSTLSLADALRQTRDFVSFQIRNDLSQNEWLRQTSMSAGGDDLFASFSCYEIDFPALRSREYLANRLARECLAALKQGEHRRIESRDAPQPPTLEKLTEEARSRLGEVTRRAGNELAQRVEERCRVDRRTPAGLVLRRFDERFEAELVNEVWATWSELTGRLGRVDAAVNDLRLDTSRLVGNALAEVRSFADDAITRYAGEAGLKAVQAALDQLRMKTQEELLLQEKLRRKQEDLCDRHRIPVLAQLTMARSRVRLAAERKPDLDPIHLGLLVWALLSFVLGAPLAGAVAYLLDLHLRPNWLEWLLGPAGGLTGGLVLWGAAWLALRWYERRRFAALKNAIAAMAEQVRSFFWGGGEPPERERTPSVRSFLESRLELTGAVATRGFAATVFERVLGDASLVYRLVRSLDIQMGLLGRQSESLGVQATMGHGGGKREDLSGLFDSRNRAPADRLIDPEMLHRFFQRRVGDEVSRELAPLIAEAGSFTAWREQACLTDSERILRHCRTRFEDLVSEPIANHDFFADTVGQRLVRFVSAVYPNLGFGAGFKGYEGLDPDNVRLIADATLVIHSGLQDLFREAQRALKQERPVAGTLDRLSDGVRPNAAYMLSLVQGIRVHSVRNLRRFESFHNRATMPDDRTFPLTPEPQPPHSAVNPLTGYRDIGSALAHDALRFKPPTRDDG
ncbi:MAG TPA: hypothetical protein VFS60_03310, partial [Thermoanaerobaculia bacterium]|nr:hypothetical protein [Thermoanaerobaculia bacterium]